MSTSRRGFLGALAATVAGPMMLDPERLLWRPGAKLISIPKPAPQALTIRNIRAFDPIERRLVSRMDVLYGFGTELKIKGCAMESGPGDVDALTASLIEELPQFEEQILVHRREMPRAVQGLAAVEYGAELWHETKAVA